MAQLGLALEKTIETLAFEYLEAVWRAEDYNLRDNIKYAMLGLENALGYRDGFGGIVHKYSLTFSRTMENVERVIYHVEDTFKQIVSTHSYEDVFDGEGGIKHSAFMEAYNQNNTTDFVLDRMGFNRDGTAWEIDWNEFDKLDKEYDNNTLILHKTLLR